MSPGEWITDLTQVRKELKPEVAAVVIELMRAKWRLRRQGHKFRIYGPCGVRECHIGVNGTPQNPVSHARKVKRMAAYCPDEHERLGR